MKPIRWVILYSAGGYSGFIQLDYGTELRIWRKRDGERYVNKGPCVRRCRQVAAKHGITLPEKPE